jgi:uncharacterized SAM-binding protein YcdF (DUF218 family)
LIGATGLSFIIRELLLPPISLFLLSSLFYCGRRRYPKAFEYSSAVILALLFALSLGIVSRPLARSTESRPPVTLEQARDFEADVIVVLGAGVKREAPEYEGLTVPSERTMHRLFYAYWLAKRLELPILACGGYGESEEQSEAAAMALALKEWGFEDVILEPKSRNTHQNALYGFKKMEEHGFKRALVVTTSSHMERAVYSFAAHDCEILPAPTGFTQVGPRAQGVMSVVPSSLNLESSSYSFRVYLGRLWYKLTK